MAKIKTIPEDFVVEEILKTPLKKEGAYRVYKLTKKGLETDEAIRKVAKSSSVPSLLISYCGLKDKNAVTTQFIAVPSDKRLREPSDERIKLKEVGFLNRKLSPSLIKENKFTIKVRNAELPDSRRVEVLRRFGIPNYYGEQRFTPVRKGAFFAELLAKGLKKEALLYLFTPAGWEGSRDRKGKKVFISGNYEEAAKYFKGWRKKVAKALAEGKSFEEAFSLIPKREIEFQFNVFQSFLFNEWLAKEVMRRTENYLKFKYKVGFMVFPMEDVGELKEREVGIFHPEKEWNIYEKVLRGRGVEVGDFLPLSCFFHPFKRRTFAEVKRLKLKKFEWGVKLSFSLPSGSYATNVVRFLYDAV
ncbi:tRNA pseudouridine13 synthase [Desulfurobacterium pacificum]|uniref:tRNA pseudouridine13 synthase n=1 Tax=Desulfurobacterium pacificum TaxID=240166 RepID=A0ABY1NJK5_9BACT|nr:tRNA pseudouridine(13) synthase TruD [Desulfurobacterium pacificum]SMP10631.1 tRNA pseudouridine13 synthase [Desulfurobacterium pacificum]